MATKKHPEIGNYYWWSLGPSRLPRHGKMVGCRSLNKKFPNGAYRVQWSDTKKREWIDPGNDWLWWRYTTAETFHAEPPVVVEEEPVQEHILIVRLRDVPGCFNKQHIRQYVQDAVSHWCGSNSPDDDAFLIGNRVTVSFPRKQK